MTVISRNPSTGETLGTFDSATKVEVEAVVSRSRSAQERWAKLALADRRQYFDRLKSILEQEVSNILELVKLETGRVIPDGEAEVYDVIDGIRYYSEEAERWTGSIPFKLNEEALPNTQGKLEYIPLGVIGLIMPWNFPFYSPGMFAIAATMAGNGVVIKPSEYSTMVGIKIGELFERSGFPHGLVSVVAGADDTGVALSRSPVDKIFFVGSVETGRQVISNAGGTPVQVELGGNSAALVLKDVDLELAAQGVAWGATYHSGQDCVGIKRIFVDKAVSKEFIARLMEIVSGLRQGVDYGPYISRKARDNVASRIQAAVGPGAQLLVGGEQRDPGYWLTPSVLLLKDLSSELVRKETFGNVAPVIEVASTEEAIKLANSTGYGLSNAIFCKDEAIALEVARRLEAGMTFINDPLMSFPGGDHWTGWKDSGVGTVETKYAQCLKKRVITVNRGNARSFWYPY